MKQSAILMLACAAFLQADEGLWLFDQFPAKQVEEKYKFKVSRDFLEKLRSSSVRLNNGGSGSFVSPHGLLFTNHHVASDCLQKLSTAQHNYMADGFYAATQTEEKACPDLEVNVLRDTSDVTTRVNAGINENTPPAEANKTRRAAMAEIVKECGTRTGNRCDVVTLFAGGQYHLYEYAKYTDVRLVFAPEEEIAAFGGDPDNFTFPRYCLDITFFRVYKDNKPLDTSGSHFRWSREGVQNGELAFVPGHPGTTGRLATVANLEFFRDKSYPLIHERLDSTVKALLAYGAESPENRRVSRDNLLSAQNSYKAYTGFLAGLRDAKLIAAKREQEKKLRAAIADDPKKQQQFGKTWDEIAAAYDEFSKFFKEYYLYEASATRGSDLLRIARDVVRLATERTKPNGERLREYAESAIPSLEQELYSPAPITDSMEIVVLTDYFSFLQKHFGANDPTVKAILGGRTPKEAAKHYVSTSKLKDISERKRLAQSAEAVKQSNDGMIRLALLLDEPARKYRAMYEDKVQAVLATSAARIAQARFAVFGANGYPDATFTLRLSYSDVRGYKNAKGEQVPYATRTAGLFQRATGKEPFRLPKSWLDAKPRLNPNTPFNFVSTNDTHGGNSGSPTLNTKGEVIGILFDGNLEGLPNRFLFTDEQARSVHVATQIIDESLRVVYKANRLIEELSASAGAAATTSGN